MKYIITKTLGKWADETEVGKVHLEGAYDTAACGLADEDFESKPTNRPITCPQCKDMHEWAKKAAKLKS